MATRLVLGLALFVMTASAVIAQTVTRPTVSYSTYLGGSTGTSIDAAVSDANGYQYVLGSTSAKDFPTTSGAYRRTPVPYKYSTTGYSSMFVAKFNKTGSALVYSTFIATGIPLGIAVDKSGNVYVLGVVAFEGNLPITSGAWKKSCFPDTSCHFVFKLNATGSALSYSTYVESKACTDAFRAIAVDSSSHPYITGWGGPGCYTTSGALKPTAVSSDALVMKFASNGSSVLYSTYLGGDSGGDEGNAIIVDSAGNAIVGGNTFSTDFPTTAGAFQRSYMGGGTDYGDGFVARLNSGGSSLLASSYIGGSDDDRVMSLALDPSNQLYAAGQTYSKNFPVTPGAVKTTLDPAICDFDEDHEYPCNDAFIVKLPSDFSRPGYVTFAGGDNGGEELVRVAVDNVGHAYIVAVSASNTIPLVKPTETDKDMWLAELNTGGSAYLFSTRYGGPQCCAFNSFTGVRGLTVDPSGNAYIAGSTPGWVTTTSNAFQKTNPSGSQIGFAAKWDIPPCTLGSANRTITICTPVTSAVPKKLLLAAGATDSENVTSMKVYVDGNSTFTVAGAHFNTYLNLTAGAHHITVKAWDSSGSFSTSLDVNAQ